MRAVVMSDSHGRMDMLEMAALEHAGDADLFVFCGDGESEAEIVGYEISPVPMIIVRGNCDPMSERKDYAVADFAGHRLYITHGYRFGVKSGYQEAVEEAKRNGCDILLFGHTHIAYTGYGDGVFAMNPGSLGRPRKGKPSYGILDITEKGVFLSIVEL